ncbi:MAG: DUF169 domain-containing protein [Bacteroidetes bacterium]|nr:DUF169 domain-containing protein [Bacteroidota bacterium]
MKELLKSNFISRWQKNFPEAQLPFVVFYSNELHESTPAEKHEGHRCIIADLTKVSRGSSLAFNASNIGCGGGNRYCGFSKNLRPGFEYFLSYGKSDMEGERYKKNPEIVLDLMNNSARIETTKKWLIAKPFDKINENDNPQAVIFFANPDVLSGLFTLANFDRTDHYAVKTPFSAGCGSIIQFPILENKKENQDCFLGMFDVSARPYVPANVLSFGIPIKRFETLVSYMDESFMITDSWKNVSKRISKGNSIKYDG